MNTETKQKEIESLTKIESLAQEITEKRNGNRARQLVNLVAKHYKDTPPNLKEFFNHQNEYIQGISTSAYGMLTGDLSPIQEKKSGGWGITLPTSKEGLSFSQNQLWFAKLSGYALSDSENSGYALGHSKNRENALWFSENRENALGHSKNRENALLGSKNSGDALSNSENSLLNKFPKKFH